MDFDLTEEQNMLKETVSRWSANNYGTLEKLQAVRSESLGFSDESLPADQRIELEQQRVRVRAAIEKLPEKERRLLQGYYFQGKTLEEAGAEIGQSKSWASRLHARAIERLKELLNEE